VRPLWRGSSGRIVGRRRHVGGGPDQLGLGRPALLGARSRRRTAWRLRRRTSPRYLEPHGSLHWRGHHRRRSRLDARQTGKARGGRPAVGHSRRPGAHHLAMLVIVGALYVAVMSFLVSGICGYMAGLIGASNSPLSGIGILAVVGFGLILVFGLSSGLSGDSGKSLVAYALFVTAVVFAAAAIANNNLQDLKTGQLVDATPWKQQAALVVGVVAGAAIIPPILDLLNRAYGFAGAPGNHEHPLPAPQAGLISALAQGVIQNNVDWSLIEIGGAIGVGLIVLDAVVRRVSPGAHLSPLAVGLGMYLPTQ